MLSCHADAIFSFIELDYASFAYDITLSCHYADFHYAIDISMPLFSLTPFSFMIS
jgi:hypothetical protein